eukprot:10536.XXX_280168_279671_1 [CDS] Oithona nana genome sequencing.
MGKFNSLFATGFLGGFFGFIAALRGFNHQYNFRPVEGHSMTPTFNPTGAFFKDVVLIRSCKNNNQKVEGLVGQVVYVQRKERRLIKRLTQVDSASQTCWLQSDNTTGQYYDSNIFGFVPCDCISGHVQGIVWPLNRIKKLP